MPGPTGHPNLSAMRGRRKGGAPAPQATQPQGLAAHAEGFLSHLRARAYSPASIDAHRSALRQFTAWAHLHHPCAHPTQFTRAHLETYQHHLHHYRSPRGDKPLGINTQLARLGCLRRFFAWLCRNGTLPANPAADLDLPRKQTRRLPKSLSPEEIDQLLAIPNPTDPFGLRDRALLELLYATGIRRTELTNLDLGDYDPATQTLFIRKGKGGKDRLLPVGQHAAAWLARFLAEARPLFHHLPQETALFLTGYGQRYTPNHLGNWIKKLLKRCGIDKPGSCHLFRHTCATDMHRGGADIRYVQEMLGHERMETTQIYTHVNIAELTEIHARSHPHGLLPSDQDTHVPHSAPATPETKNPTQTTDSPSHPAPPLLMPEPVTLVEAPPQLPSAHLAQEGPVTPPNTPPEDDPPTGNLPIAPEKPPTPSNGGNSHNPLVTNALQGNDDPPETMGVTYYGYRWYDPTTGRWPSRDPIEEASGVNLYLHCSNDSLNKFDMFGLLANDLVAMIDTVHSGAMSAHKASETEYLSRIQGENPQVTIPGINSGNPFSPKQPREYGGRVCEICTEKEDGTVTYSYYLTTRLGEWPHTRIGARVWLYGSPRCNPRDVLVGWWHTHPSSLIEVRTGTTQQSIKYKYYWSGGRSFSTEDRGMLTNDMQNPNGLPIFVTYREGSSNHKWKYSTDMFPNGSSVKKTDELQPEWVTYKNGERMSTY